MCISEFIEFLKTKHQELSLTGKIQIDNEWITIDDFELNEIKNDDIKILKRTHLS